MKAEPAHATADSRRHRLVTGLVWCLIQAVITVVLMLTGAIAALAVNHNARAWLQRSRLDPVTGVSWKGERRYRFWGRGSKRLEAAFAYGAKVPVYYPPGRPSRFIIDVPFAPTMADFFL